MDKIVQLDAHLSNMIAAGEVVERPSGIVKELIENSIDAGAKNIEIKYEEGGMKSIEVSDDGEGMSVKDLELAFRRHSTSKIRTEDDLTNILSFGFRGEALPSIASVSYVEAISNDGSMAHQIRIDNGKKIDITPAARNQGTSIKVKDLFLLIPARLKYIRNLHYESSRINDIIEKFAMGHPEISFKTYKDNELIFHSIGNNNLLDVYYRVHGSQITRDSYVFNNENFDFNISGIFTKAEHNRSNPYSIWIYVNKRMVRYPALQRVITDSFRKHLMPGRFPIMVLNIEVDPIFVDVNVHPSKWEIRMSEEKSLFSLVENTIYELLNKKTEAPKIQEIKHQIDFDDELLKLRHDAFEKEVLEPSDDYKTNIKFKPNETISVIKNKSEENQEQQEMVNDNFNAPIEILKKLKILSQFNAKYLLAEGDDGLYIIDQHAAMERIRYEYYQDKLLTGKTNMQDLLIPKVFEGRRKLVEMIEELNQSVNNLSIQFEVFGESTLVIRSIPTWIKEEESTEYLNYILDSFESNKKIREEDLRREAIATLACHSSIRFNEYLSMEEMKKLLVDLSNCDQPYHCPHGRPTLIKITHEQLIKEFKR